MCLNLEVCPSSGVLPGEDFESLFLGRLSFLSDMLKPSALLAECVKRRTGRVSVSGEEGK